MHVHKKLIGIDLTLLLKRYKGIRLLTGLYNPWKTQVIFGSTSGWNTNSRCPMSQGLQRHKTLSIDQRPLYYKSGRLKHLWEKTYIYFNNLTNDNMKHIIRIKGSLNYDIKICARMLCTRYTLLRGSVA